MNAFDKYIVSWGLIPDGEPIITHSSKLLPVRYQNIPAMLKIAMSAEERAGGKLMIWWEGQGVAKILVHDDNALLMERSTSKQSLVEMVKQDRDEEASRIICSVATKLHAIKNKHAPSTLVPLSRWFRSLDNAADHHGGIFNYAAKTAHELLNTPQENVVLHGDIHHGNILDFGVHGWLAIDPKGLFGERGFDFANIFCNPDFDVAIKPGRLQQQVIVVSEAAGLDHKRLMKWILAYAGLSAAWHLEDGTDGKLPIAIANIAFST